MQLNQLQDFFENDLFPSAIDELNACESNEQVVEWRKNLGVRIKECLLEDEEPEQEYFEALPEHNLVMRVKAFLDKRSATETRIQTLIDENKKAADQTESFNKKLIEMQKQFNEALSTLPALYVSNAKLSPSITFTDNLTQQNTDKMKELKRNK